MKTLKGNNELELNPRKKEGRGCWEWEGHTFPMNWTKFSDNAPTLKVVPNSMANDPMNMMIEMVPTHSQTAIGWVYFPQFVLMSASVTREMNAVTKKKVLILIDWEECDEFFQSRLMIIIIYIR